MHIYSERIDAGLRAVAGRLTAAHLSSGPPGKWTTAQIVEHLGRAFSGTAVGARRALEVDHPIATTPSFVQRAAVILVVDLGYMPSGRRSPKAAEPIGADPALVVAETLTNLRGMDEALASAEARFGSSVRLMDHPIIGPLSVRQWRRLHWVHTRHHLRQIEARIRTA